MVDYAPPSFSLGLDLGFDSELQPAAADHSTSAQAPDPSHGSGFAAPFDADEDVGPQIPDSDPDSDTRPGPARPLKRLRRGLTEKREPTIPSRNVDDDVEEFSSQEDKDAYIPTQYHSVSSSSKIPLRGSGALTSQSSCYSIGRRRKPASDVSASVSLEAGHNGLMFPKLTTSPLRRFQLIDSDSDSDDPPVSENVSRVTCNNNPSSRKEYSNCGPSTTASETKKKSLASMPQNVDGVDLWKDFSPIKKFNIHTPAFDEVCQEYFQYGKDKTTQKLERDSGLYTSEIFHETISIDQDVEQHWNVDDPLPPAHHYFFHDDKRMQNLVRTRFPNFSPLVNNIRGKQQKGASIIDYMGQFSDGEASKRKANNKIDLNKSSKRRTKSTKSKAKEGLHPSGSWTNPKQGKAAQNGSASKSSKRGRNKLQKSTSGEVDHASGNWVEPRSYASTKRVQANAQPSGPSTSGQASGHWYTGPGGRKVYVSNTGKESSGATAYRLYRKESGRPVKAKKAKVRKEKTFKKR